MSSAALAIHPPSEAITKRMFASASNFVGAVPKPEKNESLNVLVTGASRGIGLTLARQLAEANDKSIVFAAARNIKAQTLVDLASKHKNVVLIPLDVDDDLSIEAAAKAVSEKVTYLDVLVNNAGVGSTDSHPLKATRAEFHSILNTNVAGVFVTTQHFLPLLKAAYEAKRNPRVINISSPLGSTTFIPSIAANFPPQYFSLPYSASKAALNNVTVQFAAAVKEVHFTAVSPGWVKTDMGSQNAALEVEDSAQALRFIIETRDKSNTGQFVDVVSGGDYLPF